MNKKYASYSALLLTALVAVSVLLNRDIVHGVEKNTDVALSVSSSSIESGNNITLTGTLDFSSGEEVYIHQVALVVDGAESQDLEISLPAETVTSASLVGTSGATGTLLNVTMAATGLILPGFTLPMSGNTTLPAGTLPGNTLPISPVPNVVCPGIQPSGTLPGDTLPTTLPSQTLPGGTLPEAGTLPGGVVAGTTLNGSGQFKATSTGAAITHTVVWQPTIAGSYQAQLVITLISTAGCSVSRSPIASFSVTEAPSTLPVATSTPTATTIPTATSVPTVIASPTSTSTATPTITSVPNTPTITPTPFATPEVTPVTESGQTSTYVTSQSPATITDAITGIQVSIPVGAIPGDGRAFAITRSGTLDDAEFIASLSSEVQLAIDAAVENLPSGTVLVSGNKIIQLDFVDSAGLPVVLLRKITLKFPFTADDFAQASAAGADLAVASWDLGDDTWSPQPSTIDFGTFSVRSQISCCSFFTLAMVSEPTTPIVATPVPVATPTAVVPEVGDIAPSSGLLVVLLMVGVALVGGGTLYIRRRSES